MATSEYLLLIAYSQLSIDTVYKKAASPHQCNNPQPNSTHGCKVLCMKNKGRAPNLVVLHRADCVAACCFPLVGKSDYKVSHTLQQLIPVFTTVIHHSLNHAAQTVGDYTININEEIWEGNQAMFFIKKHTFLSLDHLTDGVHSTAVEETSKGN